MSCVRLLACWVLVFAAAGGAGAGQGGLGVPSGKVTLNTGLDFRTGDYGLDRDTDLWYAPLTVKFLLDDFTPTPFRNDQLELGVTLAYVEISGPNSVVTTGTQPIAISDSRLRSLGSDRHRGFGDVVGRVAYLWFPGFISALPAFEITARAKFPTGDEDRGLGTGAFETSGQLDVYRSFGSFTPIASFGYRFFGASREFRLRDGPFASAGLAAKATDQLSGGLFLDWRRSASRGTDDLWELLPYVAWKASRRLTLQPYAVAGFGDGSAAWGVGLQLSTSFDVGR